MTAVVVDKSEPKTSEQPTRRDRLWRWGAGLSRRSSTLLAAALYVLGGIYVTARLWVHVKNGVTSSNEIDYVFFQFVLSHAAQAVANLDNPFFSEVLNAPHGVNMMANTSMLGISLPLAPVTLLFGPKVSFVVATVIAMAGTATAWYWFMLRHLGTRRMVAFLAAALAGFAPGIVSQSNAHPNIAAQFMLPLIVSRLLILREQPTRAVRHGVILGLLVVYQLFINEEVLLYATLACAAIALTYALSRWDEFRRLLKPYFVFLGTATALACVIMAYPLWFQFFGPQSYVGPFTWAHAYGVDVAAYTAYASESIGGRSGVQSPLSPALAEENAYFGWPICLLAITFAIAFWRVLAIRLAAVTGALLALLSVGPEFTINKAATGIPGPWKVISKLPLFDAIIVTRLALGVAAALAVILALSADRIITSLQSLPRSPARSAFTALAAGVAVLVLLPVAPTPLPSEDRPASPAFFTGGTWQRYVKDGTIVPVPPDVWTMDGSNWLVATEMKARIADGYFLGPTDENNRLATFGGPQRPTGKLLIEVAKTGGVPLVTAAMKRQALEDIRYWQADILVLGRRQMREQLRRTVEELLGRKGTEVDDVVVWDVRDLR